MKLLMINSSGRTNGNTECLLKGLEKELLIAADKQQIKLDITHVHLSKQNIQNCQGCRACFDRGNCPVKDDISTIEELVFGCDALILASPVYLEDVNGIMKNWLDRMAFYSHRPAFYGKCAVVIATSGSGSSNHTLNTMKNALTAWGFHVLPGNKFRMGVNMEYNCMEKQYKSKLFYLARDLIDSIQSEIAKKPTLFSLISFHIQQKYYRFCDPAGAMDHAYWEEKGWLDPQVHFYTDHSCNPLKLLFARAAGTLIARIFIGK